MIGGHSRRLVGGTVLLLLIASIGSGIPVAAAAGSTGMTIVPTETTADTGDRVAVDVIVANVDGGVGAWEGTLNLSDGSVADIVTVRLHGDPGLRTVDIAADNDSVRFDAALADTNDTGRVSIATVTLELTASGQTSLALGMDALGDEAGNSYQITETEDGTVATTDSLTGAETPTATDQPTSGDGSTGVVGGDESATENEQTETAPTATSQTSPTETQQPTTTQSGGTEQSTTTTDAPDTTASTTQTSTSTSAPGFTALVSLLALLLGTVLLLRRR